VRDGQVGLPITRVSAKRRVRPVQYRAQLEPSICYQGFAERPLEDRGESMVNQFASSLPYED